MDKEHEQKIFSATVLPMLRAYGWKIEVANDHSYSAQLYNHEIADKSIVAEIGDEWYSAIDNDFDSDGHSSGQAWFGLELGIMLDGEKINLLPVLQKLLPQVRNSTLNIAEDIYAKLDDGRYVKLPAARVKNILQVLEPLTTR